MAAVPVIAAREDHKAFSELADTFGEATLFGQSPVVASMFYDFESADEDPTLVLDRSLLEEEYDQ